VAAKSILDIRVVEHTREAMQSSHWLHGHLSRHAASWCGRIGRGSSLSSSQRLQGHLCRCDEGVNCGKIRYHYCREVLEHLDTTNWIDMKQKEYNALRLRPHPYEFAMYYDV